MNYCSNCVYPSYAVALEIDEHGVCSACRVAESSVEVSANVWELRKYKFNKLIEGYKNANSSNYDCIIPVSGGKDSYFQAHKMICDYSLKPLLVTYHGNNYLPEGDLNRDQMRHVFNADHLVMGPSVEVIKKLNRICFRKMGDMNWHNHCGIMTYPIQVAVKFSIPLIIWGETFMDYSGMYDADDFPEFSARNRHEHDLRGFEWYDMLSDPYDTLVEKDLLWLKYPEDSEILKVGVRGVYLGNYFKWDPNLQTQLVSKKYGWTGSNKPFERTYRTMSNLDDRYENGVHDLLKFIKLGYGRASDHASKDIRLGYMSREDGIEMVRKYDHVVSSDLYHWLSYVDMSEEEFWKTADTFRSPQVWWIENNKWHKHNIWGGTSSYGDVHLDHEQQKPFIR